MLNCGEAAKGAPLFFSVEIYLIRKLRLKFAKFYENFKNKQEAEILKRI